MNTGAAAMRPLACCRPCLGWWGLLSLLPIPVVAAGIPATTTPANVALPDLTGETVHMLGVLGLVLGTIYLLSWMLKRAHGRGRPGSHALRSVAALSVGARERVVLIQVGERQMLIGVAPGNVRLLRVLEDPVETVTLKTPPAFSTTLQRMVRRGAGR